MSILLGSEILKEVRKNNIHIRPFIFDNLGPNSYDVRLGPILKVYDFTDIDNLDCNRPNPTKTITIDPIRGYVLEPDELYLGHTMEKVGSDLYIPMYEGRSSMARLGIQSHLSAGFGDIGFKTNWTLEITVVHPVRVYADMRIGQIYFHRVNQNELKKENLYDGKYVEQSEPQESLSFMDCHASDVL